MVIQEVQFQLLNIGYTLTLMEMGEDPVGLEKVLTELLGKSMVLL